ncbi:MAG: AsmA family protein, partial [Dichotomicrobium sp.]
MNGFLAALTSLLIAVFAAAFAAPYVVDWNEYRSVFEAQASKLTGRPVRVAGDVDLTILPVPEVRFEQVSIADSDGNFDTPSAKARAFRMALSVPPLLRGKIEARTVVLDGLSLRLGLDEAGNVDWPRLDETAMSLPFLPGDVSLKSVALNDASLEVARPGEAARWRVDGVTGALSAESLRGPFKFSGRAAIGTQVRNVQISLGRMSAEGTMPVKAVSRGEKVVYRAEGDLREQDIGPVFTGEMKATAPRSSNASPETPPKWEAAATGRATLDNASLSDLKLTMTRNQRPQSLTGTAELSWERGLQLDAELQSQWLDLNLLAGEQVHGRPPAEVLLHLPTLLGDVPIPARRARIDMRVAQISLGGDIISDLNVVARRGPGGWGVESLEAGLPGGSGLTFEGEFARRDGAAVLAGTVHTSGSNLGRLLQWASPDMFQASDAAAKTFSLSGEIESAPGMFNISDIAARLGDSRLTGSAELALGEHPAATVLLDARTLDLVPYIGEGGTSGIVRKLLAGSGAGPSGYGLDGTRWRVSMRADRLVLPELAADDVEASLRIDSDAIAVERFSLRGGGRLRLTGAGRYPRADSRAEPALQLTLGADDADALARAAGVIPGAADRLKPHLARLRAAMPLSLTASLRPSTIEDGARIRIDGTAGQTALLANARLFGAGRYHVSVSAENRKLDALLRQIAPGLTGWVNTNSVAGGARFTADFADGDGEALHGNAAVEAGEMRLAFDGTAHPDAGTFRLDGDVSAESPRVGEAFALAGLSDGVEPEADGPLELRAAVSAEGDIYTARDLNVRLNGQTIGGTARLDISGAVPETQVALTAARFDLASAAALLLDPGGQTGAESEWPNAPFAMDSLARLSGSLSVAADTLVLAGNLALNDAEMTAHLEDGALRLPRLSGKFYGGDADASAELRPARGRTIFSGEIAVSGIDLARLPHGEGAPLASGRADFDLQAKSEGLSPRGLMTVMSG